MWLRSEFQNTPDPAHNTQNSFPLGINVNSVNCVQGSVQVEKLFCELRELGVNLSIDRDGKLSYDAPAGVMTDRRLAQLRGQRDELLAFLEQIAERAAIMQHDGGLSSGDALRAVTDEPIGGGVTVQAEPVYLPESPGFSCPWCRSMLHLMEMPDGLQCGNCNRRAWHFDGRSMVRADCVAD